MTQKWEMGIHVSYKLTNSQVSKLLGLFVSHFPPRGQSHEEKIKNTVQSISTTIKALRGKYKQGMTNSSKAMPRVTQAAKQMQCFLTPITAKTETAMAMVAFHHSTWDSPTGLQKPTGSQSIPAEEMWNKNCTATGRI